MKWVRARILDSTCKTEGSKRAAGANTPLRNNDSSLLCTVITFVVSRQRTNYAVGDTFVTSFNK
jgi:hypothetical protein